MTPVEASRQLLDYLARALVSEPERVRVAERTGADGEVIFTVAVGEGDAGKLIGRAGGTIRALRKVVAAAARARSNGPVQRVRVEIETGP